jgi:uncharacterized membrane protein YhaH (DUF805 family)
MTSFGDAVKLFFQNYANFTGRASRSMYWWVMLFNFIVGCACVVIGWIFSSDTFGDILSGLYSLAVLVPSLAISVRRMHDIGKGGGWIFISLIPIVGTIWFIVLCLTDSQQGDNRFGPMPVANGNNGGNNFGGGNYGGNNYKTV